MSIKLAILACLLQTTVGCEQADSQKDNATKTVTVEIWLVTRDSMSIGEPVILPRDQYRSVAPLIRLPVRLDGKPGSASTTVDNVRVDISWESVEFVQFHNEKLLEIKGYQFKLHSRLRMKPSGELVTLGNQSVVDPPTLKLTTQWDSYISIPTEHEKDSPTMQMLVRYLPLNISYKYPDLEIEHQLIEDTASE